MKVSILVVEDDVAMRDMCIRFLVGAGYEAEGVEDGEAAVARVKAGADYQVALVDLKLPKLDGIGVLSKLRELRSETRVVIMTGFGTVASAVKAMKLGAADYLLKPLEKDTVLKVIKQQLHVSRLEQKIARLQSELRGKYGPEIILSRSKRMEVVTQRVMAASNVRSNVLIIGESGTGKEVIAKAIHYGGKMGGPFIAVNCTALPQALIESELFGHRKGAFTGAETDSIGLFRAAEGGSLLLDEIFEIPPEIQVKLLRAIQERSVRPVGSTTEIPIDARIIATTNKDPASALAEGDVRKDLFYRLSVMTIHVPPLRDRTEDVTLFIDEFSSRLSQTYGFEVGPLDHGVMEALIRYSWPGNIRELENVVEQWFAMELRKSVTIADLPEWIAKEAVTARRTPLEWDNRPIMSLQEAERELAHRAMEAAENNKSKAASMLGISRKKLYKILEETESLENNLAEE